MPSVADHEAHSGLDILRHSAAHLLAAAVRRIYPEAKYAIGPPVENGFYYDIDFGDRTISERDLERIENEMRRIVKEDPPYEPLRLPRAEAIRTFRELGQDYKLDILEHEAAGDKEISCYRTGEFLDLCRGPHVPSAGAIKAFKLLRLAGAYWRGDEKNKQLQRVYGTAWTSKEELTDYLQALAEAEKRDHKKLGRELDLFALDPRTGAGNVIWMPNGATVRREIERWVVDEEVARGYLHVYTPDIAKLDLYKTSGHWQKFQETMFPPMVLPDGDEMVLRPMNCPHHILVYSQDLHSYRELPMRIAEIGTMYRYEKSGELMGMIRVRTINLNDAHIFCTPAQLKDEILGVFDLAHHFMRSLGVADIRYRLSTWDRDREKWVGTDEQWEHAIAALQDALETLGVDYFIGEGEAAFYGPKVDFQVRDAARREFTNNTVQVDFQLPERFELDYVAEDGSRQRPIMVHRGAFGAMERMIAYLIEKYAGAFPTWLAPVQVTVIPIADRHLEYAQKVAQELRSARLRVEVDNRSERMGKKIRDAQTRKVPYMAVVGDAEQEGGHVNVRNRAGEQSDELVEAFAGRLALEVVERRL